MFWWYFSPSKLAPLIIFSKTSITIHFVHSTTSSGWPSILFHCRQVQLLDGERSCCHPMLCSTLPCCSAVLLCSTLTNLVALLYYIFLNCIVVQCILLHCVQRRLTPLHCKAPQTCCSKFQGIIPPNKYTFKGLLIFEFYSAFSATQLKNEYNHSPSHSVPLGHYPRQLHQQQEELLWQNIKRKVGHVQLCFPLQLSMKSEVLPLRVIWTDDVLII